LYLNNLNLIKNFKFNILLLIFLFLSIFYHVDLSIIYINLIDIFFERFRTYNSNYGGWFEGYKNLPTTQITIYLLCFYISNYLKYSTKEYIFIINIALLSFLIIILFPYPKINTRLFVYFLPIYFILMVILSQYQKIIGTTFIIIISIIYYISNYV